MTEISQDEMASRLTRLIAVVLDTIFVFVLSAPVIVLLGISFTDRIGFIQTILIFIINIIAFLILNVYFLDKDGQTLGKKILKIKIVQKDGSKVILSRILLLRYFPFMLLGMLPLISLINLVDALMIFRKSKYCLHDDFANTKVVNVKAAAQ